MPTAFDGTKVPIFLDPLPCGGIPKFDNDSGYAYRCNVCGAVIGSIGIPRDCAEMVLEKEQKEQVWKAIAE